jgi:hypothetical protein
LTLCAAFGILQFSEELKKVDEKLKVAEKALENKVREPSKFTLLALFSSVSVSQVSFGCMCAV